MTMCHSRHESFLDGSLPRPSQRPRLGMQALVGDMGTEVPHTVVKLLRTTSAKACSSTALQTVATISHVSHLFLYNVS